MIKKTILLNASVALTLATLLGTSQVLAQHVKCCDTITQNTKLDSDLDNCIGNGVVIGAPNITLDLGGYRIDGDAVNGGSMDNGIDNTAGYEGVTIKNGRIREFTVGVKLTNATNNRLKELVVSRNGEGISLENSDNNHIESNTAYSNGIGISVNISSDGNLLEENTSFGNEMHGIAVENDSNNNRVRGNTTNDNDNWGIIVAAASGTLVERNVANGNGTDGILAPVATTLRKNTANNNVMLGINAMAGVTDGGGNKAKKNGDALQCVNVVCK